MKKLQKFIIFLIIFFIFLFFYKFQFKEKYENRINKTIWLLWFQGWDNAPYLQKRVAESWRINNPNWKIEYLDMDNLKKYITDIEYIYDENKTIGYAAKSDIIRLSLLKNHGGIWADSTLLCMQPLDSWVENAIENSNFWMYHGNGAGMDVKYGPCSWFIVSKKGSYIITKWKEACDKYWNENNNTENYFWMDELFKKLFESDIRFKTEWNKVPYLSCEDDGSSHTLDNYDIFSKNQNIEKIFEEKPPYVLKFWNHTNEKLINCHDECSKTIGPYAIELSSRVYTYNHFK
jgi:hypothetical protein